MSESRTTEQVPVSKERLRICLQSTDFWVDALPRYADRNQRRADGWAIASGTVAALTGVSIWPVLTTHSSNWAKAAVSAATLLAAIFALVPRIKNYAENAGQARELSSRYGSLRGKLIDLTQQPIPDPAEARAVLAEFQATKEKKDALRLLPDRTATEMRQARAVQAKMTEEQKAALDRKLAAEARIAAARKEQEAIIAERHAAQAARIAADGAAPELTVAAPEPRGGPPGPADLAAKPAAPGPERAERPAEPVGAPGA